MEEKAWEDKTTREKLKIQKGMNVQDLIDFLETIEDKEMPILTSSPIDMWCDDYICSSLNIDKSNIEDYVIEEDEGAYSLKVRPLYEHKQMKRRDINDHKSEGKALIIRNCE